MTHSAGSLPARLCASVALLALLAACDEPLDFDLRGRMGGFSTAPAAQQAVTARPAPDARGVISYPNYQVVVAQRGDTVAAVAGRIGMTADELARYNGLMPEDGLRDGEVLALPRRVAEAPGASGVDITALAGSAIDAAPDTTPVQTTELAPAGQAPAAQAAPTAAPEPVRHQVTRGETAYTVARLYQVSVKDLAEWNGLGPDFAIREGQYLLIPLTGTPAPNRVAELPRRSAAVTEPGEGSPTPTPPSAATPLPAEQVAPRGAAEAPQVKLDPPTQDPSAGAAMAFPVTGKIIRTYSKGRNEGIDISAPAGTPVTAAADGSVAAITSSADKVPIVVVRHADGLLTVYANVDNIRVKKGDSISRGQTIAELRQGDNAYVHFEVRNGFDSVDPMPYLE